MAEFLYDIAPYVVGFIAIVGWLWIKGHDIMNEDRYDG